MSLDAITHGCFAGHETFPFRFAWLPKAVEETYRDSGVFGRDDAIVRFGVGKNMVRAIRHWGLSMGVLEEVPQSRGRFVEASSLGRMLFAHTRGCDRYFEDIGTAWLLHWELCSRPDHATTWYWVFSHAPQLEFTRGDLQTWLTNLAEQKGWSRVAGTSLRRDVDTFLRTYTPSRAARSASIEDSIECPFIELGLLRQSEGADGTFALCRGLQPSLPDEIFTYSLARQLERSGEGARTVPLHAVAFAPGSPGRVFCLTEDALLARLERVATLTDHAVVFDDTAGLRQLLVKAPPDPTALLKRYYDRTGGRA